MRLPTTHTYMDRMSITQTQLSTVLNAIFNQTEPPQWVGVTCKKEANSALLKAKC